MLQQAYGYDSLNRLQSAGENATAWQQTYDLDRFGNRAVRATSYLPNPQLTPQSVSLTDFSAFDQSNNRLSVTKYPQVLYDFAGNLKRDQVGSTFTYDGDSRQLTASVGGASASYFYDGDGRRVKKVVGTVTTVFIYNASGQLVAEYVSDPVPPPAGGGGTSYVTSDHLGSTRVVTKGDGSVKARYDYLPYGEELPASIGGRSSVVGYGGEDSTRQKFTAKERDNESGLDYFLARYYSSAQGRFTSPDPLLTSGKPPSPQSWNRYVYCLNSPFVYVDPSGLDWYRSNDNPNQPVWFDNDPGKGYTRSSLVYWAGDEKKWVKLDQYSANYTSGFETEQAASGYTSLGDKLRGFLQDEARDFKQSWSELIHDPLGVLGKPEVQATFAFVGTPQAGIVGEGISVASGASGEAAEMTVVRTIGRGEKIADIINEAKGLTFGTGNEHALVRLANGERALVSGGEGGINFAESQITRLYGHTHPFQFNATGPSMADRAAVQSLGQRSSWLLEHGQLFKFGR